MVLEKVASSNLAAIGYDDLEGSLIVQFNSGQYYKYLAVPRYVYDELRISRSKGSYFQSQIRNVYNCDKIEVDQQ